MSFAAARYLFRPVLGIRVLLIHGGPAPRAPSGGLGEGGRAQETGEQSTPTPPKSMANRGGAARWFLEDEEAGGDNGIEAGGGSVSTRGGRGER